VVLVKCASCFELVYEKSPFGCPRCGNPKFRRMSKAEQAQFSFVFQSAQQSVQRTAGESGSQSGNSVMAVGAAGFMASPRRR